MRVVMWLSVRPGDDEMQVEAYRLEVNRAVFPVVPQIGDEVHVEGMTLPVARRIVRPDSVDLIFPTMAQRPKVGEQPLPPTLVPTLLSMGWERHEGG